MNFTSNLFNICVLFSIFRINYCVKLLWILRNIVLWNYWLRFGCFTGKGCGFSNILLLRSQLFLWKSSSIDRGVFSLNGDNRFRSNNCSSNSSILCWLSFLLNHNIEVLRLLLNIWIVIIIVIKELLTLLLPNWDHFFSVLLTENWSFEWNGCLEGIFSKVLLCKLFLSSLFLSYSNVLWFFFFLGNSSWSCDISRGIMFLSNRSWSSCVGNWLFLLSNNFVDFRSCSNLENLLNFILLLGELNV